MKTALARILGEPDAILTNPGLPGMSWVEVAERFRSIFSGLPIIALTLFDKGENIFTAPCNVANG